MSTSTLVDDSPIRHGTSGGGLAVSGVRNPSSVGVSRYVSLLTEALAEEGVDYRPCRRGPVSGPAHYHLANSSRAFVAERSRRVRPFAVTVHDVTPRSRALRPLYRLRVYPRLVRDAQAVIVHSAFAADLLTRETGALPRRLEVIPHPAPRPRETDRRAARRALGWPEGARIAVLPGVIRPVKLVREAVRACASTPGWQLALAGRLADARAARAAARQGMFLLADPDDLDYERAIVAADCVLCLRAGSVGETNGPLLDALGAGRAVLATPTGSIVEVANGAVELCDGTEEAIREALARLADDDVRAELECGAAKRALDLTWERSAELHAALFGEVFDV